MARVKVIGAGLAGAECAWQLASRGVTVDLFDTKPDTMSPAHKNPNFCELVCSNSLKNDTLEFATGLLKAELRRLGSFVLSCADEARIPAANTLSVDREKFASLVTQRLRENPNINVVCQEVTEFDLNEPVVVAAGPLCSPKLSDFLRNLVGEGLYFYDAVAPIVSAESIDYNFAFYQDRWGESNSGDYLNCPLTRDEYTNFCQQLAGAERVALHDFESEVNFEGCLPIEVMAKRGIDVLRCGPLKPQGIEVNGKTPYAVVQLRRENTENTMFNLVGFQTNLTFGEQRRVFSLIPALRNAEWLRYGVMHRNTYINAPKYLNHHFSLKNHKNIMFAGQISGVEGYTESIASGLVCGINMARQLSKLEPIEYGTETCIGALGNYLEAGSETNFQPMHINWGLLKPIDVPKNLKKRAIAERALAKIDKIKESV